MFASSNNNCNNINATIKAMAINIYNCLRTQFNLLINFINTWALPRLINKENRKKCTLWSHREIFISKEGDWVEWGGMGQNVTECDRMRQNEVEWGRMRWKKKKGQRGKNKQREKSTRNLRRISSNFMLYNSCFCCKYFCLHFQRLLFCKRDNSVQFECLFLETKSGYFPFKSCKRIKYSK